MLVVLGVYFFSGFGVAQQAVASRSDQTAPSIAGALQDDSPAQQSIEAAKRQIQANPKKVQAFNNLAIAYLRRARETADPKYCQDAEQALSQGFSLDSGDFQLQKTQVALMLARHEFTEAKEKATLLNRRTPDDVKIYGYLAEADIALGNYPEAERSTQWMLNMLPNNVPGLLLGARLRMLYGDPDGALQLLNLAYTETSPIEVEELARIANQIASVQIESGKSDAAVPILERAEQLFPHYPYTLQNLARVRLAQHRANDAVDLLLQAKQIDSDPHILYELGEALEAAGRPTEARATYMEFGKLTSRSASHFEDANCDLILLYASDPGHVSEALKLAQHEMDVRQDVWTLDAYAWALYANGKYQEAEVAVQKAIAVEIQSAQIFDHAGHIAQKLNHAADAAKYFELAIRSNPLSEYSADARGSMGISTNAAEQKLESSRSLFSPVQPLAAASNVSWPAVSSVSMSASTLSESHDSVVSSKPSQTSSDAAFSSVPAALLAPHPTDTGRLIRNAQATAAHNPKDANAYASLGAAYFQSARETGDVNDYELAEQSLTKSLDLVSADFSANAALGTMAEVCMGEHRFADALSYSQKALSLGSGDLSPFAIVGDAYADMGEYDKASVAYARLTLPDGALSPRAAYARDSRISYLNFISGDTASAIRLMKTAVAEGIESKLPSENLAWLHYELGEYYTQAGDAASANSAYLAALTIHPGDYRALAALGKLRANKGSYAEAIVLYQKAIAVVPMPIFIAELGDLYAKSGNAAEAKKQYQLVEYIGLLGHINKVLHNRDLAIFYADHDIKLTEALELAQRELEVRHDVYTWDALAWALYKNGRYAEAGKASDKALQFGTRDSLLLFHAGVITEKLGRRDRARSELKKALQINPHFHLLYADAAQQRLAWMDTQAASNASGEQNAQ